MVLLYGCGDLTLTLNLNNDPRDSASQGGLVIIVDNLTIKSAVSRALTTCDLQDLYPVIDRCRRETVSREDYGVCVENTVGDELPECAVYTQVIR